MFKYARKKHLYQVAFGVLFLGLLLSTLAWSSKAHAAASDSILAVSVQPYVYPFSAYVVGESLNQQIATITDYNGPGDPIDATIDWGDKTPPTQESFIDGDLTFPLSGAHAYSQVGKYTVTVTVSISGIPVSASGTGTITAVPAYVLDVKHITPTTGKAFNGIVATGTDPFASDYFTGKSSVLTGTIDWGDNSTPTSVQTTIQADGAYQINAIHTYSQSGNWTVTVYLNSDILGPISAAGTATSSRLPQVYKVNAHNINAKVSKQFCSTVATVTGTISKKGLSITINWGDGTNSKVTLKHGKGTFQVRTCHTYSYITVYPIVIDTLDNGTGETTTALGTATVA